MLCLLHCTALHQGAGRETADFFRENFGLSGRVGAALLLGAHSFGTFNHLNSQFKYDWTKVNKIYPTILLKYTSH